MKWHADKMAKWQVNETSSKSKMHKQLVDKLASL
jgi:hypothetical protein